MPTTSNFGWTTPADTDLVKDGALAIRTLGNGIDTSFLDLKGGTTGQNLRKASNTDLDFTFAGDDINTVIDAEGDLLVGDSADTLQRLAIGTTGQVLTADTTLDGKIKWATPAAVAFNTGYAYTSGAESSTSTSYAALTTATSVTVTTGTKALVIVTAGVYNNSNSATAHGYTSYAISGATTVAASDERANMVWINTTAANSANLFRSSAAFVHTGLTAGSNTFAMQYKVNSSENVGFNYRSISVVDLGS